MRIGVLGGSFDPPHIGHALIARQILEQKLVDQIWLMPCFSHPFDKKMSSSHHRLAMTRYLQEININVSDLEIKRKQTSYTINTLLALSNIYPIHKFQWIMGSDQMEKFYQWKSWETIIKQYGLIIFPRIELQDDMSLLIKRSLARTTIPKNITFLASPNLILSTISSSSIRNRRKKQQAITHLVPPAIEKYIQKHDLYIS